MKFQKNQLAQTYVFFLVSFGTLFLLCGLALDAGFLYLSKAKLSRACDAAAIAGVGNFTAGTTNTAIAMRNIAVANYSDLSTVAATNAFTYSTSTNSLGGTNYIFTFSSTNGASVVCKVSTGSNNKVTTDTCSASSPTKTYFMGYSGISSMKFYTLSASATAKRGPRLITLVLDRSGSMLGNGGAQALPPAVTNFLSLFDTNFDNIGIVSFSSFARMEIPLTNNFWVMGTNVMQYATNVPVTGSNPGGMKFGGVTCSDEGMRMAMEMMKTNSGYTDPATFKYIVFFTDGEFNSVRSLFAAPHYAAWFTIPSGLSSSSFTNSVYTFTYMSNALLASSSSNGAPQTNVIQPQISGKYCTNVNIWLPSGSALFQYRTGALYNVIYSQATNGLFTNQFSMATNGSESNLFFCPGYLVDAVSSGYMAINNNYGSNDRYPTYAGMTNTQIIPLMGRNFTNLISDYILFKPEDNGADVGLYYPGGAFYWPYDNYVLEYDTTRFYNGVPRNSTNIGVCGGVDQGYLFYNSSGQMTSWSNWTNGAPGWLMQSYNYPRMNTNYFYNTISAWRPNTVTGFPTASGYTNNPYGGYALWKSGTTTITNNNVMAYSSRATHFYDFSQSSWTAITNWDNEKAQMLPLGNWKTSNYCYYARADGVTIYTIGFSTSVTTTQQSFLQAMANDPAYNPITSQPEGKFYYTTNSSSLTPYFKDIADQIRAVISQ